ncbi:MAG: hypothetical protein BWY27_00741 [Bacteroidetes bacterium ADurb.Bin234]|nr:MAG: hypothetical protein BWY27_00741 [Bacteroidetes bacterium ADurb.Bin234]
MKRNIYLLLCVLAALLVLPSLQAQKATEVQESRITYRQKNLGVEKKKTIKKTRRGGIRTYPEGIADKNINMGFTLGGGLALMDALNKQKCPYGGTVSLFMHGVLENTNTVAVGAEIKGFYLLANNDKYTKQFEVNNIKKESLITPTTKVGNWLLGSVQLSVMGNFNPRPRFNIQIKANAGPLVAMVPVYETKYQIKEVQSDGTYKISTYDYKYQAKIADKLSLGLAFTVGTDMLFAITKHTEFKAGIDWSYLRFNYTEVGVRQIKTEGIELPELKPIENKQVAQFGVFDIHVGFAFSF